MKYVKPKKFLGQHFLKDLQIASDIADTIDTCPHLPVLEVGPGMGVLTQFLLRKEREIKAVEVDTESVAYLTEHYPQMEGNIIEQDFLKMDLTALFNGKPFSADGFETKPPYGIFAVFHKSRFAGMMEKEKYAGETPKVRLCSTIREILVGSEEKYGLNLGVMIRILLTRFRRYV